MSLADFEAMLLYRAMFEWETRMIAGVGRIQSKEGTFAVPDAKLWDNARQTRVQAQRANLRLVTTSRNWLFHNTSVGFETREVLRAMGHVLHKLEGIKDNEPEPAGDWDGTTGWKWLMEWEAVRRWMEGVPLRAFAISFQRSLQRGLPDN